MTNVSTVTTVRIFTWGTEGPDERLPISHTRKLSWEGPQLQVQSQVPLTASPIMCLLWYSLYIMHRRGSITNKMRFQASRGGCKAAGWTEASPEPSHVTWLCDFLWTAFLALRWGGRTRWFGHCLWPENNPLQPQALTPSRSTPPGPQHTWTRWHFFNEAQCRLKLEQEMASCWKCLSHGNKSFTGEGGTWAIFNEYF